MHDFDNELPDASNIVFNRPPARPTGKVFVRQCVLPKKYDQPPGNICVKYIEACDTLGVNANSSVVKRLLRRVRQLQPLPYHKVVGLTRAQMLDVCFDHIDEDGSGFLDVNELMVLVQDIDPRARKRATGRAAGQAILRALDADGDAQVTRQEYHDAMEMMLTGTEDDEFSTAVLEILSSRFVTPVGMPRAAKLKYLFRRLDVDESGGLPLEQVATCATRLWPRGSWAAVARELGWADALPGTVVSLPGFLAAMDLVTTGMADADIDAAIRDVTDDTSFGHDFSDDAIGDAGVAPLAAALAHDLTFTGLSLRGCGIRSRGATILANLLASHPCVTALDVSHNPIGDAGGEALLRLLTTNRRLVDLRLDGTDITRRWSNTTEAPGPRPFDGAAPLLAALAANRAWKPPPTAATAATVAAVLRDHADDVKVAFLSCAGPDGRVAPAELAAALQSRGDGWGVLPDALLEAISHSRLLAAAGDGGNAAPGLPAAISYASFCGALRSADRTLAVLDCFKARKHDVKVIFYDAAAEGGVTLPRLVAALQAAVSSTAEDGAPWGITASEVADALTPERFGLPPRAVMPPAAAASPAEGDAPAAAVDDAADEAELTWGQVIQGLLRA